MNILLDDISGKRNLYPFASTRSVADIRIGILTIREKWQRLLDQKIHILSEIIPGDIDLKKNANISANVIPSRLWVDDFLSGKESKKAITLEYPWQIFQNNEQALKEDFELICQGRISQQLSATNKIICSENIFIEDGAVIEHSVLNATAGPIYIGKNAEVMEGCLIRGPFALCEGGRLKMGTKVYGATTIGPYCLAGGEIKNSVLFGFSNKAHDGYLGDSVIGEWCNVGAGTTNSNLKNTASEVKVWTPKGELSAGTKCGVMMGDYSRTAINTAINTGTVIGVGCNVFG